MPYSQRARTERLICIGRVVLASASLVAVRVSPTEPVRAQGATYGLLAAYLAYSIVLLWLLSRIVERLPTFQIVTHVVDLAVFAVFTYLTEGPHSPFLGYYVFGLVAGTLRWQWRGTVWTAAVAFLVFVGISAWLGLVWQEPYVDLDHFIILAASLVVVATLLAFTGVHESRLRDEIDRLSRWSHAVSTQESESALLAALLEQAAHLMDARRALYAWDDGREPWLSLAYWDGERTLLSRSGPTELSPLVVEELRDRVFVCSHARAGVGAVTLYGHGGEIRQHNGECVNPILAERFDMDRVISAPVELDEGEGRLFLLGRESLSPDDLALMRIVARDVSASIAQGALRARLRESAVFEERVRMARDLHDGLLQSLTGSALQVETARRLITRDPAASEAVMEDLQSVLAQEQRELRAFVDTLVPDKGVHDEPVPVLRARLMELRERVARQWPLEVEATVAEEPGAPRSLPADLARDLVMIANEGLGNSARHAGAGKACVRIRIRPDRVDVVLHDDGRGFTFHGRRSAEQLRAERVGPATLVQRVEERSGTLCVDSSAQGSRIEISIPLRAGGTDHSYPDGSAAREEDL